MENRSTNLADEAVKQYQPALPETLAQPRPGSGTGWEVVVGQLVGLMGPAEAMVEFPRINPGAAMKARTVVSISEKDIGQQAVLAFEDGDLTKPIILGLICTPENIFRKVTVDSD